MNPEFSQNNRSVLYQVGQMVDHDYVNWAAGSPVGDILLEKIRETVVARSR